jgi:type IV secretory pathway TrbF-like protein
MADTLAPPDAEDHLDTRYTRPRLTRAERLRSPVGEAHRWQMVARLGILGFLLSMTIAFYFAWRNTGRLHVITVDQDNHVLAVGAPDIPEARQVLAIKRDLVQVVEWIRTIPADPDLLKLNWKRALLFMTPEGAEMLKQFAREIRPDQMAKEWRVRVQVQEVQPVTPSSYLVEWEERLYKLPDMSLRQVKHYTSVLSFVLQPPTHETDEARLNWLGVKIYDAHWYPRPDFSGKPAIPIPAKPVTKGAPPS